MQFMAIEMLRGVDHTYRQTQVTTRVLQGIVVAKENAFHNVLLRCKQICLFLLVIFFWVQFSPTCNNKENLCAGKGGFRFERDS